MQALTLSFAAPLEDRPSELEQLVRFGDIRAVREADPLQRLAHWLHQPTPLPAAPVTAAMDLADFDPAAFWLRLDPVHLVPDRDTLVLFPARDALITEAEARALIEAFNAHFREEGVRLEYGAPDRWYVRVPQPVDVRTTPLHQAIGANLHFVQPQGAAVRYWNRLINEAQMLFFQHPVNEARRAQGLPELNGLWLWGEGRLPALKSRAGLRIVDQVGEPFLQALADLIEADYAQAQTLDLASMAEAPAAFVWLEKDDALLWRQLRDLLKRRQVSEVLIDVGAEAAWYLKPTHLRRIWRRWLPR